jgi:hypothetical protein
METIWTFETAQFRIAFEIIPEDNLDLSWDDDGSIRDGLDRGLYVAFTARIAVYHKYYGKLALGCDYLSECIYESPQAFMNHRGGGYRKSGSYFPDMVREAVAMARKHIREQPPVYIRPGAK